MRYWLWYAHAFQKATWRTQQWNEFRKSAWCFIINPGVLLPNPVWTQFQLWRFPEAHKNLLLIVALLINVQWKRMWKWSLPGEKIAEGMNMKMRKSSFLNGKNETQFFCVTTSVQKSLLRICLPLQDELQIGVLRLPMGNKRDFGPQSVSTNPVPSYFAWSKNWIGICCKRDASHSRHMRIFGNNDGTLDCYVSSREKFFNANPGVHSMGSMLFSWGANLSSLTNVSKWQQRKWDYLASVSQVCLAVIFAPFDFGVNRSWWLINRTLMHSFVKIEQERAFVHLRFDSHPSTLQIVLIDSLNAGWRCEKVML